MPETQSSYFSVSVSVLFVFVFPATKSASPEIETLSVLQTYIFRFKRASANRVHFCCCKTGGSFFFFFFFPATKSALPESETYIFRFFFLFFFPFSFLFFFFFFFSSSFFQRQNQLCLKVTLGVCCKLTFSDSNVHSTATAEFTFASVKREAAVLQRQNQLCGYE